VPVACLGTKRNLPCGWFKPLLVRIGKPISLEQYHGQKTNSATLEQLSGEIMKNINELLNK